MCLLHKMWLWEMNRSVDGRMNYATTMTTVTHRPCAGNRWVSGTAETSPTCPATARTARGPCRPRTATRRSPHAPPTDRWTMRMPARAKAIASRFLLLLLFVVFVFGNGITTIRWVRNIGWAAGEGWEGYVASPEHEWNELVIGVTEFGGVETVVGVLVIQLFFVCGVGGGFKSKSVLPKMRRGASN